MNEPAYIIRLLFDSSAGERRSVIARYLFLRALAAIYFSAFFSLLFQIKGLIGPQGILPAGTYLPAAAHYFGHTRFWAVPSLFWISSGSAMLMGVMWLGLVASVIAFFNLWPRLSLLVCFLCFLSFVAAAGDFSSYQSDGMLLEAGFLSLFFAPSGLLPGWASDRPPSRASLWLLRWEWFRIYFESGLVKLLSGDAQWRDLTAMDAYYQNSPLPTWIGWYVQHLPHWFHATTVVLTLVMELVLVCMLFCPRPVRLLCFCIVTPWQIGVILTGNYAFLNYLVLVLGVLLIDDIYLRRLLPAGYRPNMARSPDDQTPTWSAALTGRTYFALTLRWMRVSVAAICLTWIGYVTSAELLLMLMPRLPLPMAPVNALAPSRIANQYGLFAVMTRGRYEIEFQGSNDGQHWRPYLFRYKPQLPKQAPGIYAPYQPRFDWNLWFASLGDWQQNDIVPLTEERLLEGSPDVLALFRSDPFAKTPPHEIRAVLWQYRITTMQEKRSTGFWWSRKLLGLYAPTLTRSPDGHFVVIEPAQTLPPHD